MRNDWRFSIHARIRKLIKDATPNDVEEKK